MNESTEAVMDGSSLLKAVYHSRLRLTRLLLEGGAYINESNEYGETPLMVACKTQRTNPQSVPKPKMVRYLLENGADPNIQDKTGKTALMHSCLEQTEPEVLSLLLDSGADPTLEDHAGLSALVYAVNSGNRKIISVLLGACKAKGKEVIIITTSKMASDHQMRKQYLNIPPFSPSVCSHRSPYESQTEALPHGSLATPSLQTCSSILGPSTIMFQPGSSAQPLSSVHISDLDKQLYPYKVYTEQRSKSPSLLLQQGAARIDSLDWLDSLSKNQASSLTEEPVENTLDKEELSIRLKALGIQRPTAISRHHASDVKDGTLFPKSLDHISGNENAERRRRGLGRKMSDDSAPSSLHALSHPNLHQDSLHFSSESSPVDEDSSDCLRQLNISSLQNVVNRRSIGMDHYSSDSQLLQVGSWEKILKSGGGGASERHKPLNSRHFTLSETKDSLESFVPRRGAASLERRGSGALLLDRIAHTRPGFLPPLNPCAPIPDIGASPSFSSSSTGQKSVLPSVAACPQELKIKKMLWRRHSMQSEQMKQLVSFKETLGN